MAMNAYVQLALIEKAKRVFGADAGIFLSFPLLSPVSFKPDALAALSSPSTTAGYAAAADFARITNFVPRDIVATNYGERYLWDVYSDVLTRADVADGSAATTGEAADGYTALLYDLNPDGTHSESAAYRAFRQYRDAWIIAREDYGARKLSAELAGNADAVRHWTEVEEPALRAALGKAESDWKTLGRRDEIEAALQAERDAAVRNPRARWQQWSAAFNPDIDLLTEPSGTRFAPTGISPKDFASNTAWLQFDLSAGEMAELVNAAPAALKVVLEDDAVNTIERVSFEYRSVAVVRPWFQSAVLSSRIWRSSDPDLMLSDGGEPASGTCPAYVTAMVFIRNLELTSRPAATEPTGLKLNEQLRFTLPVNRLVQRDLKLRVTAPTVTTPSPPAAAQRAFERLDRQTLAAASTLSARPAVPRFVSPSASAAGVAARRELRMADVVRASPAVAMRDPAVMRARLGPIMPAIAGSPAPPTAPQPAPSPPAAPPTPTSEESDEVGVLAFICKRLPKMPDPLPDLQWKQ